MTLGDLRAAASRDRLENDPSGTAVAAELLHAAGSFRRAEDAERLLACMEKDRKWRDATFAVLAVGDYDQPIEDPEDERPDRRGQEKQFPRREAVLTR